MWTREAFTLSPSSLQQQDILTHNIVGEKHI
jgi:hypothetical protein